MNNLHDSSNNLTVSGCDHYDNFCEIENVDISHEMPFTITKNENIPPKNHIMTIEPRVSNDMASNSKKGKMVKFEYKRKSFANKPLYNNKHEAKKDLNKFVSGGTSVHEYVKFYNNDCFSHKNFHNKQCNDTKLKRHDESKDVSTSYDMSKNHHKICFS